MKAKIINNSNYLNSDFLEYLVKFICKGIESKLPKFSIEYHHLVFDEDKNGVRIYFEDSEWDGTAFDDNRVWISVSQKIEFPTFWEINPELSGKYLTKIYLENLEEFLVWISSHEIFHIYQWKNPDEEMLGKRFGGDCETACDLFASMVLRRWRAFHKE